MEQTRTPDDAGSPAAVRERAEMGREILGSRVAQGEPGQKQPAHDDPRLSASKTVEKLNEMAQQFESPTYKSSFARSQEEGNLHPVPPEERTRSRGPQVLAAAATAAGAIGAARDALALQLESDARLASDPRYERDQKVYDLGQAGKLPAITPTDAELAARVERAGMNPEIADKLPKTPEQQIAQDMPRLEELERRPAGVGSTLIEAGQQDFADKNNGKTAQEEGRTGDDAVARAKANDLSAASTPTIPANRPTTNTPSDVADRSGYLATSDKPTSGEAGARPMTDAEAEARNKEIIK
jgi:hypothetical protein